MRELIRHILKENRLQQELKQVIEDNGIFDAIDMVGGLKNFKKLFKNDPEFSEILDELTGVVDFSYYEKYLDENPILFPFKYEIVGIKKNRWNTNSWPELNLIYDEDKLSPSENETLKSIIAVIQNDNTTGKIKTKTLNFKDSNYFDVTQINGKDVELHEDEFPFSKEDVKRIYDKLYGESESLNESDNRETDKNLRAINVLLSMVSWDGLCDIWAEYNPDDKEYEIRSKTTLRHFYSDEILEELESLEDSIKSMGIKVYIYAPWFVDNCEGEVIKFMNESSNRNEKDQTKLIKGIIDSSGVFDYKHFCGVDIIPPEERTDQYNFLNKDIIPYLIKVYFVGGPNSEVWPRTQAIRNKELDLMEELHEYIKSFVPFNIEMMGSHVNSCDGYKKLMKRKYTTDDLQESIIRLLREDLGLIESENKKLKLVKEMIYSLFDEVEFIEVDTNYEGKPLIKIYHDVEDTAANYDNWFSHRIQDEIKEMTGDGIILSPWWAAGWDWKYKNADFFMDVQKIEYDDEGNVINESDESKQERKFNKLIQNVEDYLNSNEYPSVKKFTVYYDDTHDDVIVNIFFNVQDSIRLGGGINSVIKRVGKQVMEDLEVFPMEFKYYIHFDRDINESKEKKPKYLNIIKDLVEPIKDEDCVCDIKVLYDEEDDIYLIELNMGTEELNDKFIAAVGITYYVRKLRRDIKETIKDYLPIDNFYVGSYASQKCNSKSLNESSMKEKSLVKLIEKDGLYNFIEMSGLDFNQVRSLIKQIDNPKEILKQYIREFVLEYDSIPGENYGSLIGLKIPLSNTKLLNDIMVQDSDQIAVEIWGYEEDEYGDTEQTEQYLTTINDLTNEELLSILSWMMETIKFGYWD
jgi:hypothetical protein